jgi:glycosyltransferase involved in cell wall biosynthesis
MKIGIFHDTLMHKGGAERAIIELANHLNADLITAGYNPELSKWIDIKTQVIDIGNLSIKHCYAIGYNLEAPLRFFMNRTSFDYDIYIFSLFSSIFAARPHKANIWFCCTPNRILYDLRTVRLNRANILKQLLYRSYIKLFLPRDQRAINNMYKIIAGSITVQSRITKYYNRESQVIYPPIDTNKFTFNSYGDFYLSVSRLVPEKRIDLIAKAFTQMPNHNLTIVGNGPERNKLRNIISGHNNIRLVTSADDKQLQELYSTCLATVYMPLNEDFGLVPLESMAAGKPCIAANEGGCKETVIDGKTGLLIKATEKDIIRAVQKLDIAAAKKMKTNCLKWVKKFDAKECIEQWKKELEI